MKRLLIDVLTFDVRPEIIKESIQTNGKVLVSGVIQRANSLNQNKRRYPKPILMREVSKYMELVRDRRSLGELDHPEESVINLSNVSHLITNLTWKGDDLIGTVEILPTPAGNILKTLFESGVKVGISSRGLGSVKEMGDGTVEVQEDFEILGWDMVSNPSTQGSFMYPIHESVDNRIVIAEGLNQTYEKYDKINDIILDIFSQLNYNCGDTCKWNS